MLIRGGSLLCDGFFPRRLLIRNLVSTPFFSWFECGEEGRGTTRFERGFARHLLGSLVQCLIVAPSVVFCACFSRRNFVDGFTLLLPCLRKSLLMVLDLFR